MTGGGTTHLHQKLLKTQEHCKENDRNAQNSFCWQCQRDNRLLSGFLSKLGKLLLKSVRAQVFHPQVAQTQKEVQEVRKIVKHEILLHRSLAGWTFVCNMPVNTKSGHQDAEISAKFVLGCTLQAGVPSIFGEQYMAVVPTLLMRPIWLLVNCPCFWEWNHHYEGIVSKLPPKLSKIIRFQNVNCSSASSSIRNA